MAGGLCTHSTRRFLTFMLILAILGAPALGATIYVDVGAVGANTGTSWQHALNLLQDGLLLAYFSEKPVEIRVARGIYRPDRGLGIMPGDRTASFELVRGVTIKGGYAGTASANPDARNIKTYETILSGNLGTQENLNTSIHIVTGSGTDATAVLDGFTITTGGALLSLSAEGANGTGMYNDEGSPTVVDCTFRDNLATRGAGLCNINDSHPLLNNCVFTRNSASRGGAVYNNASSPTLTDCTFVNNSASIGGALCNDAQSRCNLTNCTFTSNEARQMGGGIYNDQSTLMLAGCPFEDNAAQQDGGAIFNNDGTLMFMACTLNANSAEQDGGAIYSRAHGELTASNCLFSKNTANTGGAIANASDGDVELTNCTFSANTAQSGGALSNVLQNARAVMTNCILWGDTPNEISGGGIAAAYSNVQGGTEGEGNIDTDPLFADPNGDYHLKSQTGRWNPDTQRWVVDAVTSPCIDAGDPAGGTGFEPFPHGTLINMGAYGGTFDASLSPSVLVVRSVKAFNPDPPTGAVEINPSVVLSWTAGLGALVHDVYLGISFENVAEGTRDTRAGALVSESQAQTSYDPPGWLGSNQVYWWRVDETDAQGNTTKGDVWRFTTGEVSKGRSCFTPETPVWADGALVPIAQVQSTQNVGVVRRDAIRSVYRDATSASATVERLQKHEGVFTCYDVCLDTGNCITVASCHYFMSDTGRWIRLQDLTAGTKLRTATGSVTVAGVYRHLKPYVGKVYNLKVADADHYLVGHDALLARDW